MVLGFVIVNTLEFLSFCVMGHLHDGQQSCHVGKKKDLFQEILPSKQLMY